MSQRIVHDRHNYREFELQYGYIEVSDGGHDAVMMLKRRGRPAAVLPQKTAYLYADSVSGAPTAYLIRETVNIAESLGLVITRDTCRRIADAIVDGIPDLLSMPPYESYEKQLVRPDPVGEGRVSIGGESWTFDIPEEAAP